MRFSAGLVAVLLGITYVISQPLGAKALTAASTAQEITVRIDDTSKGSGVIIERLGDSYTVVTNWHVVQEKGSYTIQTSDGRQYTINHSQVKRLPGVDLAMFQFTSNQNYRVPEKGDSDQVTEGKSVYVAGYPAGIPGIPGRIFQYLEGKISGRVPNPKDGYSLVYIVPAFQGMSGGPILDEEGKLVGIHGRSGTDIGGGGTATLGIPLKTYLSLAPSAQAVVPNPISQPPNRPQPVNSDNSFSQFILAKTLEGHFENVNSVAFSPDGKTLASSDENTIKIWNVTTGQEIRTLNGYAYSVSFSSNGKTLASGSRDIKIWNIATGEEVLTLNNYSFSVAFSPDGKTLASDNSSSIEIWNVATEQKILTLNSSSRINIIRSIAFSPDGKTLASNSLDSSIKIWDVASGQEILTLNGHPGAVLSVAFSPDGKTLASASADNTIKIWNIVTGQEILTLNGHSDRVLSVAFNPDGKTLASGSDDNTIKIWNVATGEVVTTLDDHFGAVFSVAFSPDGKTFASGSADKTIKIWRI